MMVVSTKTKENTMRQQQFAENPVFENTLKFAPILLMGIGFLRLTAFAEVRGFTAELCYSGASFFFSRTFARDNQHKVQDLIITGILLVAGNLIDSEDFIPSLSR